ncbi:MAG: CPBP family intramembrane metalloprotease [Calothrix sp. SM1_7_51]|nr:CPBP family intramembrane metalloprotease [Calothrix sp. SM1_7_51]
MNDNQEIKHFRSLKIRYIARDFSNILIVLTILVVIIALFYVPFHQVIINLLAPNTESNDLIFLILYLIIILILFWTIFKKLRYAQVNIKQLIGKLTLRKKSYLPIIIVIIAHELLHRGLNELSVFFVSIFSPTLVQNTLEQSQQDYIYSSEQEFIQVTYWVILFITIVLVAPITEELLFRGIILHRWALKWGVTPSILLSSILFGLLHGDIFFASRITLGTIASLLYIKTNMLIIPIIQHGFHNFLAFLNTFVLLIYPL